MSPCTKTVYGVFPQVNERHKHCRVCNQNSKPTMRLLIFLSTILLLCSDYRRCSARDTITTANPLYDNRETVVSAGKRFELGFFQPESNSSSSKYVGIWYYRKPQTIVWIANRDNPLPDSTGAVVNIAEDGNLQVVDGKGAQYFSAGPKRPTTFNRTAKLLDSGNLVLIDAQSGTHLWQSFQNPTDTFLPGMLMNGELKLTSWITSSNPGSGSYTFRQDEQNEDIYNIMNGTTVYWRSGEKSKTLRINDMPNQISYLLTNFNKRVLGTPDKSLRIPHINFTAVNNTDQYNDTRLLLNSSGELQYYKWDDDGNSWSLLWSEPDDDPCSVYNRCGRLGYCSNKNGQLCECFPGYEPNYPDSWNAGDFSHGCKMKSDRCHKTEESYTFLNLKSMRVGSPPRQVDEGNTEPKCKEKCDNDCHCQAYSFTEIANISERATRTGYACLIWKDDINDLKNLRKTDTDEGITISVRAAVTDIASTKRDCKPCGETIIPYPLSTGPECGDPMYYSFFCNKLTGQVDFRTPNGSYEIVSINKEKLKFVIEVDETAGSCEASAKKIMSLIQSMPFQVTNSCFTNSLGLSFVNSTKSQQKIEITWNPPSEPTCNSSSECQDWPNSNCIKRRCLCRPGYRWVGLALNCTAAVGQATPIVKGTLKAPSKVRAIVIVTMVIGAVLIVCSLGYFFYRRKMSAEGTETSESNPRNPLCYVYSSERQTTDMIDDDTKGTNVSVFKLESILEATDNFSNANKLGEGGFGPVYMGRFPGGQHIAIKRLSSHSGQGMEEFQNEVVLIAKLQHRNLVRLLGYCIKRNEKILLYEYMPNKSLDAFIFNEKLCILLDWKKRFDIILGIARGLLYLHQDSRLRIIHRDLKTSNILLDEEMNPKISDFGLARIVEGKQTEANTNRVVGTYGYMSPEYALEGLFSVKSDVFSFGVIVLEIASGKRNTGFYRSKEALNLLGYAWRLWKEEKALDLLDHTLLESCNKSEVLKCINIGLLCVQEDPNDRPTMSNVVFMLGSESATIPSPNQPAYVLRKRLLSTSSSSSSKPEAFSENKLTISIQEGR